MPRPATPIQLSPEQRNALKHLIRQPKAQARFVERAKIVLWSDEGLSNVEMARRLKTRRARISKWRTRFAAEGLQGLWDDFRPGRPVLHDAPANEKRILEKLDEPAPAGFAQWNGPLLAQALDLNVHQVWQVLRRRGISLQRRRSWCVSTDPEFASKAADVGGPYFYPPGKTKFSSLHPQTQI